MVKLKGRFRVCSITSNAGCILVAIECIIRKYNKHSLRKFSQFSNPLWEHHMQLLKRFDALDVCLIILFISGRMSSMYHGLIWKPASPFQNQVVFSFPWANPSRFGGWIRTKIFINI